MKSRSRARTGARSRGAPPSRRSRARKVARRQLLEVLHASRAAALVLYGLAASAWGGWEAFWKRRRATTIVRRAVRRAETGHSRRRRTARVWMLPAPSPAMLPASAALVLAGTLAYGYSRAGGLSTPESPEPSVAASLPVLPPLSSDFDGVPLASYLTPPDVSPAQLDELLSSPVLRDAEFARAVHWWVGYWTVSASKWFPGFLTRMAWRGGAVDSALAAGGFPPSLRYLPLIESGYDPRVTSRTGAVGLWQLMPSTARGLGLTVGPGLDERRHAEKSTEAALRYLDSLHGEFRSWFLALAAYNTGPTRVRRILARYAPAEPRTDSLFWALRERFPLETREFVPKLYGAMWVASRPEAYGYETPATEPFVFDAVSVSSDR